MPAKPDTETLLQMSKDMEVSLYARYEPDKAASIIGVSTPQLEAIRQQVQIAHLALDAKQISYFGIHILQYMLDCVVPVGTIRQPEPGDIVSAQPPSPAAKFFTVEETMTMLKISRAKQYRLFDKGDLQRVKIGRRTLIKREDIDALTDN